MIKVIAIGQVVRAPKRIQPSGQGKPYTSVSVESSKSFGGKTYTDTVTCCVYGRDADDVMNGVHPGMWVMAEGEGKTETYVGNNGKTYANIKLMLAKVTPLAAPSEDRPKQAPATRPAQQARPAQQYEMPIEQPQPSPVSADEDGSDVPF